CRGSARVRSGLCVIVRARDDAKSALRDCVCSGGRAQRFEADPRRVTRPVRQARVRRSRSMTMRRLAITMLLTLAALSGAGVKYADAQSYPVRPIRLVV